MNSKAKCTQKYWFFFSLVDPTSGGNGAIPGLSEAPGEEWVSLGKGWLLKRGGNLALLFQRGPNSPRSGEGATFKERRGKAGPCRDGGQRCGSARLQPPPLPRWDCLKTSNPRSPRAARGRAGVWVGSGEGAPSSCGPALPSGQRGAVPGDSPEAGGRGRRRSRCPAAFAAGPPPPAGPRSERGARAAPDDEAAAAAPGAPARDAEVPWLCCRFSGTCPAARAVGVGGCRGFAGGNEGESEWEFVFEENESSERSSRAQRGRPARRDALWGDASARPLGSGWKGLRDPPKTGCSAWWPPSRPGCARRGWFLVLAAQPGTRDAVPGRAGGPWAGTSAPGSPWTPGGRAPAPSTWASQIPRWDCQKQQVVWVKRWGFIRAFLSISKRFWANRDVSGGLSVFRHNAQGQTGRDGEGERRGWVRCVQ